MNWIKCSEQMPPKDGKFLFSYYYGEGLGNWGWTYKYFNSDSNKDKEKYILILWPSAIVEGEEPFEWDEEYMIEMEVSWMPLPEQPKG